MKIKLWIDRRRGMVLFAQTDKDFIDLLHHMLALPLTTVSKLIEPHTFGSVSSLNQSLNKLDGRYIKSGYVRDRILNPTHTTFNPSVDLLFPVKWSRPEKKKVRKCPKLIETACFYGSYPMHCGRMHFQDMKKVDDDDGVVKENYVYIVMDDLKVKGLPGMEHLDAYARRNGINLNFLQQKVEYLGAKQAVDILKASLISHTVFTDVFVRGYTI